MLREVRKQGALKITATRLEKFLINEKNYALQAVHVRARAYSRTCKLFTCVFRFVTFL